MGNALDSVGSFKAAKYFPLGRFSSRMGCDKYSGNVSFYKFQVLKLAFRHELKHWRGLQKVGKLIWNAAMPQFKKWELLRGNQVNGHEETHWRKVNGRVNTQIMQLAPTLLKSMRRKSWRSWSLKTGNLTTTFFLVFFYIYLLFFCWDFFF